MSKEEQQSYDDYVDAVRYEISVTDTAIEDGRAEGREEGRAEGIEEGRAEGERAKATDTARKMLERGFDYQTISEMTGLPEAEILAMKQK